MNAKKSATRRVWDRFGRVVLKELGSTAEAIPIFLLPRRINLAFQPLNDPLKRRGLVGGEPLHL